MITNKVVFAVLLHQRRTFLNVDAILKNDLGIFFYLRIFKKSREFINNYFDPKSKESLYLTFLTPLHP